jgi:Phage integrase, N-terminal SAM-like domain
MRAFKVRRNQQDYFRVDLPTDMFPDGKRRSVMAKTRREAVEKATQLLQQRKKGLNTEEAKASLADFLQRFLAFYKTEGGVALRTWQDYRYHIDENVVPGIGAIALSDLKPREVDLWMKSLRERGLLSH